MKSTIQFIMMMKIKYQHRNNKSKLLLMVIKVPKKKVKNPEKSFQGLKDPVRKNPKINLLIIQLAKMKLQSKRLLIFHQTKPQQ